MTENYKDHPLSVGEIKSDKTDSGADWTPRDVLISLLRKIDSGELKMSAIIIGFSDEDSDTRFRISSPSRTIAIGLATATTHAILHSRD